MSRVELESFLKSFALFFIAIASLVSLIYYSNYTKDIQNLDETIFNQMRICSFDLECAKYEINFVLTNEREHYKLYKTSEALLTYFPIPNSTQNSIQISYPKEKYKADTALLFKDFLLSLLLVLVVVVLIATLFSLYALYPLRNALVLTQEFIKDILHDFNTPLSVLRLNSSMLENEEIHKKKIHRIQKSVQTILNLQENLRLYLNNTPLQKEQFDLAELIKQRVELIQMSYEDISFENRVPNKELFTNKEAFVRIVDNLLSNGAKYNKEAGSVEIFMREDKNILCVKDSGKGIKNPKKIFDRFYKEQERGMGIGLHIAQKLSAELGMKLSVETQLGIGTTFYLKLF